MLELFLTLALSARIFALPSPRGISTGLAYLRACTVDTPPPIRPHPPCVHVPEEAAHWSVKYTSLHEAHHSL